MESFVFYALTLLMKKYNNIGLHLKTKRTLKPIFYPIFGENIIQILKTGL
jgi:hypothetical protein